MPYRYLYFDPNHNIYADVNIVDLKTFFADYRFTPLLT